MDFQHPPLERECWFVPTVTKLRIGAQKPFTLFTKCFTFFAIMGFGRVFEGVLCREWGIFNGIFVGAEVVLEEGFLIKKGRL